MKRKSIVLFLTFTVFAFVGFPNPSFAQETARNKGDKEAAEALSFALGTHYFPKFASLLTDSTSMVVYDQCVANGGDSIIHRLRSLFCCDIDKCSEASVEFSPYNCTTGLDIEIPHELKQYVPNWNLLFRMENGKVADMFLAQKNICCLKEEIAFDEIYDWFWQLPYSLESFQFDSTNRIEVHPNAMPCMECGLKSEELDWYKVRRVADYYPRLDEYECIECEISVCPRCGHLVQCIEKKKVSCKPNEIQNFNKKIDPIPSMGNNSFSLKGADVHLLFEQFQEKWLNNGSFSQTDADKIMTILDALHLPKGSELNLRIAFNPDAAENKDVYVLGDNSELKVKVNGKIEPKLYGFVYADTTCMGAWQLYLLTNAYHMLPAYWHGGYESYEYIFNIADLYSIRALNNRNLTNFIKYRSIEPRVTLSKKEINGETKFFADIICCYWDDWHGLVQEQCRITMDENGRFEQMGVEDQTILYYYNCGMIY